MNLNPGDFVKWEAECAELWTPVVQALFGKLDRERMGR